MKVRQSPAHRPAQPWGAPLPRRPHSEGEHAFACLPRMGGAAPHDAPLPAPDALPPARPASCRSESAVRSRNGGLRDPPLPAGRAIGDRDEQPLFAACPGRDETRDKQREAAAGGSRETNAGGRGRNPGGDGGIEGTGSGHGRCSDDSLDQAAKLLQERRSVAPCCLKMVKLSAPEPVPGGGRGRYSLRSMSTQMPWVEEKTIATPM